MTINLVSVKGREIRFMRKEKKTNTNIYYTYSYISNFRAIDCQIDLLANAMSVHQTREASRTD